MKQNSEYLYDLIRTGFGNKSEETEEFIKNFNLADCTFVDEFKQTLLQKSITSKKYDIAKFLIEEECNLNHKNEKGNTALTYLLSGYNNDNREIFNDLINIILEKNIQLELENEHENQALWVAVMNAKVPIEIIKKLLERGADPHHKNKTGNSPYDMVKKYNIPELNEVFEPFV